MNIKKSKCAALFRLVPVLALASWMGVSAAEPAKPALKPEPAREAAPLYQPVLLDALKLDWEKAVELRPGVRVFRLASEGAWQTRQLHEGPRLMKIVLMRVALQGLQFTGTGRDKDWGQKMPDHPTGIIRTLRVRTADFMKHARAPKDQGGRGLDMIVASNTAPWSPWQPPYTHKYGDPSGIEISDGTIVCDNRNHYRAIFVVWKSGKLEITDDIPRERFPDVWLAHTGFGLLIRDGKDTPCSGYDRAINPRMAAGYSKDQKFLFLLTIDGRQPGWSDGAYGSDMQKLFRAAGASDAISFDGGGSATLCYWDDKTQQPVMLNRHTKSGYARPCGMNWGLYRKDAN